MDADIIKDGFCGEGFISFERGREEVGLFLREG